MICKNCHKEFDSNFSNCPYCNYPAYSQDNSNFGANNPTNSQTNNYTYQNVNSQSSNSGYSNAQSNPNYSNNYSNQNYNAYNQQTNNGYSNPNYNNCNNQYNNVGPQEAADVITLMKVLGFFLGLLMPIFWFLPIISLVLYFVWKNSKPKTASAIGKFTIIGLVVGWGLTILLAILAVVIFVAFAAGPLFEFAKHLIVELINFIPFESIRELIESIFGLLPFHIDFDLSGASMLSLF